MTSGAVFAAREALVVIDMQRDYFVDPELRSRQGALVDTIDGLVRAGVDSGVILVEVRTEHDPGRRSWTLSMLEDGVGPAIAGTDGARRVDGLASLDSAAIVTIKHRDSAFFHTNLAAQLAQRGIDHVLLCGVSTESCIAASANDAFAHNIAVTLVSDAIASNDSVLHDQTLARLRRQFRQRVETSQDVVARWQRAMERRDVQPGDRPRAARATAS